MHFEEKLALVLPTLNEAECLPLILERALEVLGRSFIQFEILVVDDDSRDATQAIVKSFALRDSRVRLLARHGQRGLAGAVLHGWRHTDAALLGVMDADLQHPPELLPKLLAAISAGADLALASRYAGRRQKLRWSAIRKAASAVSIWLARPLQSPAARVHDPLSGYFVVRRPAIANLPFRSTGFKLLLEILLRGRVQRVVEVPFEFGRRGAGRSKAGLKIGWDYLLLLATLYVARWRATALTAGVSSD
ncbi:MAG TPA: polyprenol monophosphomannose synthase [Terracidiphilus sp.]|jgi:dolichol-phosphate mannosyltransferase